MRNFTEGSADGVHGVIPLFLGGGVVGKKGVADGDATQVQADNFWDYLDKR